MSCFLLSFVNCLEHEYPEKEKRFTREQLRDAIFAVHDGASKRDAAKEFGIPLTTLIRRVRNPFPSPAGNPTAFRQDKEALFRTALGEPI